MKVLVACEFSGIVRDAFSRRGHDAISCDLESQTKIHGKHYRGDVRDIINNGFELMIAHSPCTHLCVSGARWFKGKESIQKQSIEFVKFLMNQDIKMICIENPIGIISTVIRKPDQIIQPWQFGHGETKATCLWLKNLPNLFPTNIVDGRENKIHRMSPGRNRSKRRSRTYSGIADAMADQWGSL